MKNSILDKNMFKKYIAKRIKAIINSTRLPLNNVVSTNQWLDVKITRYGLSTVTTVHRLYLDKKHGTFSTWIYEAGGEWLNIHLRDLFEIDSDYHTGRTYTAGAGWSAILIGRGFERGEINDRYNEYRS